MTRWDNPWYEGEWAGQDDGGPFLGGGDPRSGFVADNVEDLVDDVDVAELCRLLEVNADEFKAWRQAGAFIAPPDRTHEAMLRLAAAKLRRLAGLSQPGTGQIAGAKAERVILDDPLVLEARQGSDGTWEVTDGR